MAVVAGLDPAGIGAVAYILSRPQPSRQLVAYLVGGFAASLVVGGVIVFVLDDANIGKSSLLPPEIEIAVGALALLVAVLVATGTVGRRHDRTAARRSQGEKSSAIDGERSAMERLPGFEKLPQRVQNALRSESPWVAWVLGVAVGMPTPYYLAAIAAILASGVGTDGQIGALLVFNVIAFAVAEIPLVSYTLAPEGTLATVAKLHRGVTAHKRAVIPALAGVVGVYLLVAGIGKL